MYLYQKITSYGKSSKIFCQGKKQSERKDVHVYMFMSFYYLFKKEIGYICFFALFS